MPVVEKYLHHRHPGALKGVISGQKSSFLETVELESKEGGRLGMVTLGPSGVPRCAAAAPNYNTEKEFER